MTTHTGLIKYQMPNSNNNAKKYRVLLCTSYSCMYLHILAFLIETTTLQDRNSNLDRKELSDISEVIQKWSELVFTLRLGFDSRALALNQH